MRCNLKYSKKRGLLIEYKVILKLTCFMRELVGFETRFHQVMNYVAAGSRAAGTLVSWLIGLEIK